jgi:actin-like protein 6A
MHSLGRVSDTKYTDAEMGHIPTVTYELPDGNNIEVGADRFKVPELLFQPELLTTFTGLPSSLLGGADAPAKGLHGLVLDVIGRCDVDVRKDLYGGVLMTGGVAQIPNMRERLERELSEQV